MLEQWCGFDVLLRLRRMVMVRELKYVGTKRLVVTLLRAVLCLDQNSDKNTS